MGIAHGGPTTRPGNPPAYLGRTDAPRDDGAMQAPSCLPLLAYLLIPIIAGCTVDEPRTGEDAAAAEPAPAPDAIPAARVQVLPTGAVIAWPSSHGS